LPFQEVPTLQTVFFIHHHSQFALSFISVAAVVVVVVGGGGVAVAVVIGAAFGPAKYLTHFFLRRQTNLIFSSHLLEVHTLSTSGWG